MDARFVPIDLVELTLRVTALEQAWVHLEERVAVLESVLAVQDEALEALAARLAAALGETEARRPKRTPPSLH